jgi:3-phenylpropionate/trans-cinnamate dioxygenase ferredoxin subunit
MSMEEPMQDEAAAAATPWTSLMDDASLPEGALRASYPRGLNVVAARVAGTVYAVSGSCPHMGCPLFTGSLSGAVLTCPCHDWRFDVRTGQFLDAPELRLRVYPVKSEDGRLFIRLD